MKKLFLALVVATSLLAVSAPVYAGLIFLPTTYGMSPKSIGLGGAMTAVGDDYSATFYNPAALATLRTNQLDAGYLYAAPRLNGGPNGDEVDFKTDTKATVIGFSMDLSGLFNNDHGVGLGFDMMVDNNLKSFMSFEDIRDDDGQFMRYGISSVTMITGLGVQIIPQLHIGGGGIVMIKGENTLIADTDMAGNTKNEQIKVDAEPVIAPIVSLYAPVHPIISLGATYRGKAAAEFSKIDASTNALVSDSPLTTLDLMMAFKDAYIPQQVSFGVAVFPIEPLTISVDMTWYNWDDYDDTVAKGDVVKEDSTFETKDTYVPRLGIEYIFVEQIYARFGYFWEDTPFVDPGLGDTAVLDNQKHAVSVGVAHDIDYIPFLKHPLTIGATYFYHYLVPRKVTPDGGQELESSGSINGVIGSLTLRF